MQKDFEPVNTRTEPEEDDEYIQLEEERNALRNCQHNFVTCLITQKNNSQVIKEVCKVCGHAEKAQSKKQFSKKELEALHATTTDKITQVRNAHFQKFLDIDAKRSEIAQRLRDESSSEWWEWYSIYLNSDEWKYKRAAVFDRADSMCEACGTSGAEEVHHISYKYVGNEPLWDLKAVCSECHKIIHDMDNKMRSQ